ncbi:hypothetical protein [Actinoplanes sp. DH11]|uniref:hypothetical protein n=1 Tax=Actinoplanes sp. DH11 TaxID=2857011 RepID=UPI001E40C612|nr:hypothetical protein [Actinoplanes sp. DH11]
MASLAHRVRGSSRESVDLFSRHGGFGRRRRRLNGAHAASGTLIARGKSLTASSTIKICDFADSNVIEIPEPLFDAFPDGRHWY